MKDNTQACSLLSQLQVALNCNSPAPTPQPSGIQWPSYTGISKIVGTSISGVTVYVDPTLGDAGMQNAKDLLADADRVVAANNKIFGTPSGTTNVIVFALGGATDGTGGADHMACDYVNGQNIEVCASFGNSMRCSALFEAELSECSMNGNLCGYSTGEALSRWCAASVSNNALADFSTAPVWALSGMPDWVNKTEQTDQSPESTGCGMAFISWLLSLGHKLPEIAQDMVADGDNGTLAGLYGLNAWADFQAAIQKLGGASSIKNDDPFDAATQLLGVCKIVSHALRKFK